jgi:hypothetical protein
VIAHCHSSGHRAEVEASEVRGCFYSLARFSPTEIPIWVDEDQTALCPKCGIDSVIGSASGYPVDLPFLQRMHDHWF